MNRFICITILTVPKVTPKVQSLGTGMLPFRSKKVTPGQQHGGRVLLNCMDVTSHRWKEGLTLQQQGKILYVNYGQKYGQG